MDSSLIKLDLVRAVEDNTREFLLALGRAGGGEERDDATIQWTVGGSPIDYHNCVVRAELPPAQVDAAIADFCAALAHHHVPGTWHLGPFTQPATLGERLPAHGFTDGGEDVGMALKLAALPVAWPMPPGLTVERVQTAAQLEEFAGVLAAGFGEGEREARWVQAMYARIGLGEETDWRHYLGRMADAPVATASLFLSGPPGESSNRVGGLYFICTHPVWRGQGIGSAITYATLQAAQQIGCRLAVLGASSMGLSIYERLGFVAVCRMLLYNWEPQAETVP
jgi:GNAT superfamily N-acetyltransferase